MQYEITTEVGIVVDNTITYNNAHNRLENSVCQGGSALCFFIGDFALTIHKKSGKVVGATCSFGCNFNLSYSDVALPDYIDGGIYLRGEHKFIDGTVFGYYLDGEMVYDKTANILALGNMNGELCLRVCNNLFVALSSGKIVGVAVKVTLF